MLKKLSYALPEEFIAKVQGTEPEWKSLISRVTFYRTYARLKEDGSKETYWEVIRRCVEGSVTLMLREVGSEDKLLDVLRLSLKENYIKLDDFATEMYQLMFSMKFLPSGRGLWMMGTPHALEFSGISLNNCAMVSTKSILKNQLDGLTPFGFLMDVSMLGAGCGFDTLGAGRYRVYRPVDEAVVFTIPDSREGWVESVDLLILSYLSDSQNTVEFDYSQIRAKGLPIRGFGGVASGYKPLERLHQRLRGFLNRDAGKHMTSRTIVDIMNSIGECVVAGNVRRSSLIALGEAEDRDFTILKDYMDPINEYRKEFARFSNNSIAITDVSRKVDNIDIDDIVERIANNGEPGFFFSDVCRKYGRLNNEPEDLKRVNADWFSCGTNPCGEMTLDDRELCNLVEVIPSNFISLKESRKVMSHAYLYAKSVTFAKAHNPAVRDRVERNRRLGISLTGITLALNKFIPANFYAMCDKSYKMLDDLDVRFSTLMGIQLSKKLTTVKPSGTISLVAGVTAGIHFPCGQFYVKRMRLSANDPLVQWARDSKISVEDEIVKTEFVDGVPHYKYNPDTVVVSFPVKFDTAVAGRDEVSITDQLHIIEKMQRFWSDNQVSATVTFRTEEIPDLKAKIIEYITEQDKIKSVSMLPLFVSSYPQLPESRITEQEYEEMMAAVDIQPMDRYLRVTEAKGESGCTNDTCTL